MSKYGEPWKNTGTSGMVLDSRDDDEPTERAGATTVEVNAIIHLAASVGKIKPERGGR